MLTAVHILHQDPYGDVLELPLDASSGYVVKNIDGLGPVKADIVTTEYASMDGGVYQTANGNMRNIVFQIGFDPTYQSEDPFGELRRGLYPYLSPKMRVEMHFLSSNFETVKIIGYVESFEPSMFSAEPEMQISMLCPDPYFSSLVPIVLSGLLPETDIDIDYPFGAVPTGFVFTVQGITAPSAQAFSAFTVTRFGWYPAQLDYFGPLYSAGPPLTIQVVTVKGSKSAGWVLASAYNPSVPFVGTNLLGYIEGWMELVPGNNPLRIVFTPDIIGPTAMSISYTVRYVGL